MIKTPGILIIIVCSVMVFTAMATALQLGFADDVDRLLLLSLRSASDANDPLGPLWVQEALAEVTALGGYTILTIFALSIALCLFIAKQAKQAVFLLVSLSVGSLVSSLLKVFFSRARPDVVVHLDMIFTSSFPSAHAMVSMFAWLIFAMVLGNFLTSTKVRWTMLVLAVVLSLAIGTTRIYLGVHWPSDVFAGWSAGIAWAGLCALVWKRNGFSREPIT